MATTIKVIGENGVKALAKIMAQYDAKTLASATGKLDEVLAGYVKSADLTTAINTLKSDILGGAPEDYDTLKEVADYIAAHGDVVTALNSAIGNKADKTSVYTKTEIDTKFEEYKPDLSGYLKASDITAFTDEEIEALVAEALA